MISALWLAPISWLYALLMRLRNAFYDWGLFATREVGAKVVSVGNLTVGGTGKTPLIFELCQILKTQSVKFAVITRGYGRKGPDDRPVDLSNAQPTLEFGDEPVLLRQKCSDVPVWVGSNRVRLANRMLDIESDVRIILADDAYQHRQLHRDLNILVVDTAQPIETFKILPWGRARESIHSACRADVIVLSKVNLVEAERVREWRRLLSKFCRLDTVWAEVEYRGGALTDLEGREVSKAGDFVAVSGIGNPVGFRRLLIDQMKLKVVRERWYRDHQKYTIRDLDEWQNSLRPGERVVVTAKDAIKLKAIRHAFIEKIVVAEMNVFWRSGGDRVHEKMAHLAL